MNRISFQIPGLPRPGGSKKAFVVNGRAVLTDAGGKTTREWRSAVALFAKNAMGDEPPMDGPLRLDVTFFMPRPKNHYGTGKNARKLKPSAPTFHTSRPDTTKLLRALEDALTGIVWNDDAQVAVQLAGKHYGEMPGAIVTVTDLVEPAPPQAGVPRAK